MSRARLFRLALKGLFATAVMAIATPAGAQSCADGYTFCTNFGYQCNPGGCTIGCCSYSCWRSGVKM